MTILLAFVSVFLALDPKVPPVLGYLGWVGVAWVLFQV